MKYAQNECVCLNQALMQLHNKGGKYANMFMIFFKSYECCYLFVN